MRLKAVQLKTTSEEANTEEVSTEGAEGKTFVVGRDEISITDTNGQAQKWPGMFFATAKA